MTPTCTTIRERLSAYLDGELAGDRGSVVRGHLRECAACRAVADDEAALRDGLRGLEPVDPPASLWAGVQARLAAEEVAAAKQPAWRRALARWREVIAANLRPIALGTAAAAGVLVFVAIRHHGARVVDEPPAPAPALAAIAPSPAPPPQPRPPDVPSADDITADLASESARVARAYEQAASEVLALADAARPSWSADKRAQYDQEVLALRGTIANAKTAHDAQRGWRTLIRFVQGAVARDELALADVAAAGGIH